MSKLYRYWVGAYQEQLPNHDVFFLKKKILNLF